MRNIHVFATAALFAAAACSSASAIAGCTGNVTFGEGPTMIDTGVRDRVVDLQPQSRQAQLIPRPKGGSPGIAAGTCMNALIVDTLAEGSQWGDHGEFVAEVARLTQEWLKGGSITRAERSRLLAAAAQSNVGNTIDVRVIGFNDFHGNIDGANLTFRSDPDGIYDVNASGARVAVPAGGVDYMAGLVRMLKARARYSVVVSAGDLIGASPLNSALFHDEPTIETMNRLGLEFNAVGNHEFDEGRTELLRMQNGGCHPTDPNSCQGAKVGTPVPFEGADFDFLAANVIDVASGQTLLPPVGIKEFAGVKMAFIGMTLKGTPNIVTPAGVAGLKFADEADTVNALVPVLRRQGIETIVVLVHEGGFVSGGINGCAGVSGPIADIVQRLDDAVDLVVSGHTHQAYNCMLPNAAGREIPVTSAGAFSRLMTRIDVRLDRDSKDVIAIRPENVLVDRRPAAAIAPVPEITQIIAGYNQLVAPIANRVIGFITADLTRATNAAGESSLGDVIADAQLHATKPADRGGAVVAFMNPGGIRADLTYLTSTAGEGNGAVTYGEAFTVQPFGNTLVVKTMTGQQLYQLLEQQWVGQPSGPRILQVSNGFTYKYTTNIASNGGKYVCPGSIALNGQAIDPAASYRVTMNSFLASGGDNFTMFNNGTNQLGGDVDLDALETYLKSVSPAAVAPGAQNRIVKVDACA